jgi:hypothetical protein
VGLFFTGTSGWAYTAQYCTNAKSEKMSCCKIKKESKEMDVTKSCCCHKSKSPLTSKKSSPVNGVFFSDSNNPNQENQSCCISVRAYFNIPVYKSNTAETNTSLLSCFATLIKLNIKVPVEVEKSTSHSFFEWDYGITGKELNTRHCLFLI